MFVFTTNYKTETVVKETGVTDIVSFAFFFILLQPRKNEDEKQFD